MKAGVGRCMGLNPRINCVSTGVRKALFAVGSGSVSPCIANDHAGIETNVFDPRLRRVDMDMDVYTNLPMDTFGGLHQPSIAIS